MSARTDMDERVLDEALAWHRALARDDADWEAHVKWLEAEPLNRQAFDEIALVDRIIEDHKADLEHLVGTERVPERSKFFARRWLMFGSVAAAVALALGVPALMSRSADAVYATSSGQSQRIALAKGDSVDLAPSSRLILNGGDPTDLELSRGEAFFAVTHDPGRQLSIKAGDYAVTDIGTKFGVSLGEGGLRVGVSEGHVSVTPDGSRQSMNVSAGQQLIAQSDSPTISVAPIAAKDVGSWRQGRLVYSNAPLSIVAADISRYGGKRVVVDRSISDRRFSGVLAIGDGSKLLDNLTDLMGIAHQNEGGDVRIRSAASR